jgi:RNA polymerase sigma-70 factor (ECF subfamily)
MDPTPEDRVTSSELRGVLQRAIDALPEGLRAVFMLREVEGLDTDETAECLGLSEANVKVRLHRARALLRSEIDREMGSEVRRLHQFAGERCDRIVAGVLERIG